MSLAIPTIDEYAALMSRLNKQTRDSRTSLRWAHNPETRLNSVPATKFSAAQEKPLTFEKTKKATLPCAQPSSNGAVARSGWCYEHQGKYTGWTDYGYWLDGELLPGRPW